MYLAPEPGQPQRLAAKGHGHFGGRGLLGTLHQLLLNTSGVSSLLQDLDIPDHMKELYKTVWEIKQKVRT